VAGTAYWLACPRKRAQQTHEQEISHSGSARRPQFLQGYWIVALRTYQSIRRKPEFEWTGRGLKRKAGFLGCGAFGGEHSKFCLGTRQWKRHGELFSLARRASDFDGAAVFLHDPPRQRKPQARPVALGGIKRAEDVWQVFGWNAAPAVC